MGILYLINYYCSLYILELCRFIPGGVFGVLIAYHTVALQLDSSFIKDKSSFRRYYSLSSSLHLRCFHSTIFGFNAKFFLPSLPLP